ncbi:unnamed protein product, partial [Ectocarpus sp. 13 AM-2016]
TGRHSGSPSKTNKRKEQTSFFVIQQKNPFLRFVLSSGRSDFPPPHRMNNPTQNRAKPSPKSAGHTKLRRIAPGREGVGNGSRKILRNASRILSYRHFPFGVRLKK